MLKMTVEPSGSKFEIKIFGKGTVKYFTVVTMAQALELYEQELNRMEPPTHEELMRVAMDAYMIRGSRIDAIKALRCYTRNYFNPSWDCEMDGSITLRAAKAMVDEITYGDIE